MQHNEKNVRDQALSVFKSLIIASCAGIQSWHGEFISIESIGNSQRKSSHDWTSPNKNATKRNWQLQQKTQDAMIPLPLALGFGSSQEAPQDSLPILWSISLAFDVSFALQIWMLHQIQNLQNGVWLLRFIACNSNWECSVHSTQPSTHNAPNAANPRYMIVRVRFQSAIALDVIYSDACKIFSFKKKMMKFAILGESKGLLSYSLSNKMPTWPQIATEHPQSARRAPKSRRSRCATTWRWHSRQSAWQTNSDRNMFEDVWGSQIKTGTTGSCQINLVSQHSSIADFHPRVPHTSAHMKAHLGPRSVAWRPAGQKDEICREVQ